MGLKHSRTVGKGMNPVMSERKDKIAVMGKMEFRGRCLNSGRVEKLFGKAELGVFK